ncbi:MAG: Com family DNA-binding transcriptional regulator [Dehalococcoidia bacterium]|jgi:hypothetical protein|nr:Com family DNA-binding transcriptional regulator [Dehalococcoidia bacterium]
MEAATQDIARHKMIPVEEGYEVRCTEPRCNRLLFKGRIAPGSSIEIKCPKCKTIGRIMVL